MGNFSVPFSMNGYENDVGEYFIQLFDATLANWGGGATWSLLFGKKLCGHAGVIEFNGDVYACDHFVFPQYKLETFIQIAVEMMYSEKYGFWSSAG